MTTTAKHVVAERTGTKNYRLGRWKGKTNSTSPLFWGSAPDPGVYRLCAGTSGRGQALRPARGSPGLRIGTRVVRQRSPLLVRLRISVFQNLAFGAQKLRNKGEEPLDFSSAHIDEWGRIGKLRRCEAAGATVELT